VGEEERVGLRIVKFSAVVTLDALDGGAKLCASMNKKIGEGRKSFRFEAQRKGPNIV
jgi:hypothetical protein